MPYIHTLWGSLLSNASSYGNNGRKWGSWHWVLLEAAAGLWPPQGPPCPVPWRSLGRPPAAPAASLTRRPLLRGLMWGREEPLRFPGDAVLLQWSKTSLRAHGGGGGGGLPGQAAGAQPPARKINK